MDPTLAIVFLVLGIMLGAIVAGEMAHRKLDRARRRILELETELEVARTVLDHVAPSRTPSTSS